mmetsp:Transcript_38005/g.97129  ORF Transcript_38005/g.97129 Transcript_38005/m.97129 type:complete len:244 (-) Transcript_38005:675-1406(-)
MRSCSDTSRLSIENASGTHSAVMNPFLSLSRASKTARTPNEKPVGAIALPCLAARFLSLALLILRGAVEGRTAGVSALPSCSGRKAPAEMGCLTSLVSSGGHRSFLSAMPLYSSSSMLMCSSKLSRMMLAASISSSDVEKSNPPLAHSLLRSSSACTLRPSILLRSLSANMVCLSCSSALSSASRLSAALRIPPHVWLRPLSGLASTLTSPSAHRASSSSRTCFSKGLETRSPPPTASPCSSS